MTDEERAKEIARVKSIISASERAGAGYQQRIEAARKRLAELEAE